MRFGVILYAHETREERQVLHQKYNKVVLKQKEYFCMPLQQLIRLVSHLN